MKKKVISSLLYSFLIAAFSFSLEPKEELEELMTTEPILWPVENPQDQLLVARAEKGGGGKRGGRKGLCPLF